MASWSSGNKAAKTGLASDLEAGWGIREKHPEMDIRTVIGDAGYDSAANCGSGYTRNVALASV
ncbi:MAG: hypothetical protein A2Z18_08350 [Armatimonadetes bacterium RBG_16_58_9]|nr:MAG: hypothetical protein A2Z18_08350 [Armatimonadetes bacterium RBG_16_58_9]